MNNLSKYIIEKLKINKDTKIQYDFEKIKSLVSEFANSDGLSFDIKEEDKMILLIIHETIETNEARKLLSYYIRDLRRAISPLIGGFVKHKKPNTIFYIYKEEKD